ncbi:MAG: hypothetical protein KJ630_24615 [Proteobacteria bacterium]|nr:hypothetical protein [Pseudomonadota bacterium]
MLGPNSPWNRSSARFRSVLAVDGIFVHQLGSLPGAAQCPQASVRLVRNNRLIDDILLMNGDMAPGFIVI